MSATKVDQVIQCRWDYQTQVRAHPSHYWLWYNWCGSITVYIYDCMTSAYTLTPIMGSKTLKICRHKYAWIQKL